MLSIPYAGFFSTLLEHLPEPVIIAFASGNRVVPSRIASSDFSADPSKTVGRRSRRPFPSSISKRLPTASAAGRTSTIGDKIDAPALS